jgi:hypothetical protein
MNNKTILTFVLILVVFSCKKESRVSKNAGDQHYQFPLDEVKTWYQPEKGITVNWEQAEHHQGKTGEYWLVGITGRPTFAKLQLGYRRLLFFKNSKGEITEQVLEIIPDALYLQRVQAVSSRDFTGRVFIFDRDYALMGGLSYQNGVRVGTIKMAVADTGKLQVEKAPVTCVWLDNNYIDSNGELVVYAEQICDPTLDGGGGDGYAGSSSGGYGPAGSGDGAIVEHGGGGGGAGNAPAAPAVSNLPGETKPGIKSKDFMKCFQGVPDQGATMKITVYVQEPWPGTTFNIGPNSVGHTAIGLTKTSGSQTITQVVGFYPDATLLDKIHAPSKIVNNGGDLEYNNSITYTVSAADFQKISDYIANPPATYDLTFFNCTNFVYEACKKGNITLPDPYSTVGPASPPGAVAVMAPAGIGSSIEKLKGQSNVNSNGGTTPKSKGACQ